MSSPIVTAIDFETYFDDEISITTLGNYNYTRHPKCIKYLVAIDSDDPTLNFVGHPKDYDWENLVKKSSLWLAHNASFDSEVFSALVDEKVVPDVQPEFWYCTSDLVRYFSIPGSLKASVKYLFDVDLSKEVRDNMKGKLPEDLTPEKREALIEYADSDAIWCRKLWERLGDKWPEHERKFSLETRRMCRQGVPINLQYLEDGIKRMEKLKWQAEKDIPWVEDEDSPVLSLTQMAEHCRKAGIDPPSTTAEGSPEYEKWEEKHGEEFPHIGHMRNWRKANIVIRKIEAFIRRLVIRDDGWWMPYGQKYCGAHTLRDSGADGVNMQNLPGKPWQGFYLRNAIQAPEGYTFLNPDYSQIEPRCLAVETNDTKLLKFMLQGQDLYEAHARSTMGYKDPEPLNEKDPDLRKIAKFRVLGLGYGMGVLRSVDEAGSYGLDLDEEGAKELVYGFRRDNPQLVDFWNKQQDDYKKVVDHKQGDVKVYLPSGRYITYRKPRKIVKREGRIDREQLLGYISRNGKFMEVKLWGGLLVENYIQAMARDVMVDGVLRMREEGYNILMRVHDEVLVLVKEEDAEQKNQDLVDLMCQAPEWSPDLPLAAEGKIINKYEK